jgi:DNA-binding response OmpR family regulator
MITRVPFKVVLARYQLSDGYSDDIIAASRSYADDHTRIIVLLPGGTSSSIEARQLSLGADCALRDPVRPDVLLAYLEKYMRAPSGRSSTARPKTIDFIGARFTPLERTLRHGERSVLLTPREATLVELLAVSANQVVSYDSLYNEILGRQFHGDTSNMRVLLAKLGTSTRRIGLTLRGSIAVIPKSGYRYNAPKR